MYAGRVLAEMAKAAPRVPRTTPRLTNVRSFALKAAGRSPPARAMSAPPAAPLAAAASRSRVAMSVNVTQLWMKTNAAIVAACIVRDVSQTVRGPYRSARFPAGIPASSPTSPAIVRPTPTRAAGRCTTSVK